MCRTLTPSTTYPLVPELEDKLDELWAKPVRAAIMACCASSDTHIPGPWQFAWSLWIVVICDALSASEGPRQERSDIMPVQSQSGRILDLPTPELGSAIQAETAQDPEPYE